MKYDPLGEFLRKTPRNIDRVTLSFEQIELIIRATLPRWSEETYRAWWANQKDVSTRPQAKAWTQAGFAVDEVERKQKWVRFVRKSVR